MFSEEHHSLRGECSHRALQAAADLVRVRAEVAEMAPELDLYRLLH